MEIFYLKKKNYKISLKIKLIFKIVHNIVVMDNDNWNYQIIKCRSVYDEN